MSWIVELVIGIVSGVVSGIILAKLVPDGSIAPEPTASRGGAVTQQVMAANGDVAMVVGDRNYTGSSELSVGDRVLVGGCG